MPGNEEIVWPEHLLDVDSLIQDDDAASQTSQGSDGIHKPSSSVQRSRQPPTHGMSLYTSDTSSTRDYWDHDSRNYAVYRYSLCYWTGQVNFKLSQ